jgi:hypothetical protein
MAANMTSAVRMASRAAAMRGRAYTVGLQSQVGQVRHDELASDHFEHASADREGRPSQHCHRGIDPRTGGDGHPG